MSTQAQPHSPEGRLLSFVEELILDLAKTHPAITQQHVAEWLAKVIVGCPRKVRR
jgi:hypothetical protein